MTVSNVDVQLQTPVRRRRAPLAMMMAGLGLFGLVAADVVFHGQLTRIDRAVAEYLHYRIGHWAGADIILASAFSGLGEFRLLCPLAILVAIFLVRRRRWRELAVWAIGLIGSSIFNPALKVAFAIPRPEQFTLYVWKSDPGYSFPSGHTMGVAIAGGLLAFIFPRVIPQCASKGHLFAVLAIILSLLTAGALVYVGVHYISDVAGALGLSLAWVGLLRWFLPPPAPAAALQPSEPDVPAER